MKQDVIEYMVDSFVDFKGEERKIVACALSQAAEVSEDDCVLAVGWVAPDEYICTNDPDYARICRVVTVGIAVCNTSDTFDLAKGQKKAYDKALHDPKCPAIYTTSRGVAGKVLVKAFLEQELTFLKENPERIIKGYNQMKARFERKEALKNEIKNLSDKEKQALNLAKEGIDVVKCAELVTKAKAIGVELNEQD